MMGFSLLNKQQPLYNESFPKNFKNEKFQEISTTKLAEIRLTKLPNISIA